MKIRAIIAIVAVALSWVVIDFVIHGLILSSAYQATAALWRPMGEMMMGLMYFCTLIASVCFVLIYALLISSKSLASGVIYGLIYGVGTGFVFAFGSYAVMPISLKLAVVWFAGTLCEFVVAGLLTAAIVKPAAAAVEEVSQEL